MEETEDRTKIFFPIGNFLPSIDSSLSEHFIDSAKRNLFLSPSTTTSRIRHCFDRCPGLIDDLSSFSKAISIVVEFSSMDIFSCLSPIVV